MIKEQITITRAIVGVVIMAWLLVLVTNTKVLISEIKVDPGQDYYVEEWGNLGASSQSSLLCKYFNGRVVLNRVFWYSPNNLFGRDSCPFLISD